MRRVLWAPRAENDYGVQLKFIAEQDARGAQLVKDRLDDAIRSLAQKPLGRPGRAPGYFEKSVLKTSLVVAYELLEDGAIGVARIIHASRDWPRGGWPKD